MAQASVVRNKTKLRNNDVSSPAQILVQKYGFWPTLRRQWQLVLLSVPFLLFIFFNNYLPVWGWSFAFFKATPRMMPDFSKFVGLEMFARVFTSEKFFWALRNTFCISILRIVTEFTFTIALAILLNEIRVQWFKRSVQTISYLPHFISWVVASTLISISLSPESGIVNEILLTLGLIKEPVNWLLENNPTFYFVITIANLWKEIGWGAIIYLAAMTGIDPQLYEAAAIDGAGRLRRIFHITIPGISPTIRMLVILSMGYLLSAGFENILLLQRPYTLEFAEVVDTYIFKLVWSNPTRMAINIPMATAAGVANSIVSFILVFSANKLSSKISGDRLF